ncbi:hypothetical protein TorRG33x02_081830 [Trema orientale]|uniref:Uncharacterized protein n=1 Tax=Trema orientale TaxID=63057 RepID=A0A2P5FDR7_TREOI|nr:hypothetical protein TorRG33x02_081830 [Trema orientale]
MLLSYYENLISLVCKKRKAQDKPVRTLPEDISYNKLEPASHFRSKSATHRSSPAWTSRQKELRGTLSALAAVLPVVLHTLCSSRGQRTFIDLFIIENSFALL